MWYLISIINRYVSRTFLFWFGVIFFSVAMVISLFEMIELTRRTMQHDVSLPILLQMAFLKLPKILDDLLPSITFFAALVCFLRLAQSQNFVVMLSFGISRFQFISGISLVVIFLGVMNILVLDPVKSALCGRMVLLEEKIFNKRSYSVSFNDTGLWLRENFENSQNIVHAKNFNILSNKFSNIMVFQFSKNGQFLRRVDAECAELKEKVWQMYNVSILQDQNQKNLQNHVESTTITIEQIQQSTAPPETISFLQMPKFIEMLEEAGLDANAYAMVWHAQIAKIGMMFGFVLLAASFCLLSTRNRSFSLIIAVSVVFAFLMHFFEHIFHAYGIAHKIPLIAAAWIPPFITFASGYWLTVLLDDR